MIPAERDGRVSFDLAGKTITLRFSWSVIDTLGEAGVTARLESVRAGAPGGLWALAELIAAASDGAVSAEAVMVASPYAAAAVDAVAHAWLTAIHGPAARSASAQAEEERHDGDPRSLRPTWWRRRFPPRWPAASTPQASTAPRPI